MLFNMDFGSKMMDLKKKKNFHLDLVKLMYSGR